MYIGGLRGTDLQSTHDKYKVASIGFYSPLCTYHVTFAKWRVLDFTLHFKFLSTLHSFDNFLLSNYKSLPGFQPTFQQCISCEIISKSLVYDS